MRTPVLAIAVAGLAVMAGFIYLAGQGAVTSARTGMARTETPSVPRAESRRMPQAQPAESRSASQARPIEPGLVAAPPVAAERLERVEPRAPLGPSGNAVRDGSEGPKPSLLMHPLTLAAGIVKSRNYTVQLAGIDIVDPGEKCSHGGVEWNCGIVARTAFRNFLRGRALSCVLPETRDGVRIVLSCKLGKEDPALWLARYGWARAGTDAEYSKAVEEARRQGLGIYGPPPGGLTSG